MSKVIMEGNVFIFHHSSQNDEASGYTFYNKIMKLLELYGLKRWLEGEPSTQFPFHKFYRT